ncbi:MAG: UTP--glucose-1-phosphate uridylyltransferase [Thermoplasmata archaeon]
MKAVIPAAGRGTRFLPYTKTQPKEMVLVVDRPAIQYVVEEAVESGLRGILIVTSSGKRSIEDYFDYDGSLDRFMNDSEGSLALRDLRRLMSQARIAYVRQREPKGLGDAVLCAEPFVGEETFAVLLGDDITVGKEPCMRQLLDVSERIGASVVALQRAPDSVLDRYGVAVGKEVEPGLIRVEDIVEKPDPMEVSSNLVAVGRYVLTPTIFRHLRKITPGRQGELQLTDAIRSQLPEEDVYGLLYGGRRYDVGDRSGWLIANLVLALDRKEFREAFREFFSSSGKTALPGDLRQG